MFQIVVRARRTSAPGSRLALLAIFFILGIVAVPPAASAETGGAGEVVEPPPGPIAEPAGSSPFDRQGQWIWYVSRSHGGSIARIVAQAKRFDIGTLYIKAGDGGDT